MPASGALIVPRPAQFGFEFFAVDFFQGRKIGLRQLPHNGRSDAFVVVAQHVADTRHFPPRDLRVTRFQFGREVAARLSK